MINQKQLNPDCWLFDLYETNIIGNSQEIIIFDAYIESGEYEFQIDVEKDGRNATDIVTVYVSENENIPFVQIEPPHKLKFNPHEKIVINTIMDSSVETITWQSLKPEFTLTREHSSTGINAPILVLRPNSLQGF